MRVFDSGILVSAGPAPTPAWRIISLQCGRTLVICPAMRFSGTGPASMRKI